MLKGIGKILPTFSSNQSTTQTKNKPLTFSDKKVAETALGAIQNSSTPTSLSVIIQNHNADGTITEKRYSELLNQIQQYKGDLEATISIRGQEVSLHPSLEAMSKDFKTFLEQVKKQGGYGTLLKRQEDHPKYLLGLIYIYLDSVQLDAKLFAARGMPGKEIALSSLKRVENLARNVNSVSYYVRILYHTIFYTERMMNEKEVYHACMTYVCESMKSVEESMRQAKEPFRNISSNDISLLRKTCNIHNEIIRREKVNGRFGVEE